MFDMLNTEFEIGDCVAYLASGRFGTTVAKKAVVCNVTNDEVKVQLISCATDIHGEILGATVSWVKTANVIKVPMDEKYVNKIKESKLPSITKVNNLLKVLI